MKCEIKFCSLSRQFKLVKELVLRSILLSLGAPQVSKDVFKGCKFGRNLFPKENAEAADV